ncbi:hypothetical protein [Amycolatopsis sp. H20-H5]|uniref:hypothetical protein n=1 Tax=Amycolatopsis sp. H20-H5 TaxID=3046309 RepID=UPI002DBCB65C|nr:hypothetical protein [Amycolatopsis sp. H20-H5]MEC3974399.1 hypothetical protein [Amycolatopsis sp. H20-H5]
MKASAPGTLRQVLLRCTLAIGLIGMHHVSTSTCMDQHTGPILMMSASSNPNAAEPYSDLVGPAPGHHVPARSHELMHLCLAVLCAAGISLLVLLALMITSGFPVRTGPPFRLVFLRLPGHPPDRRGRSILTSLCLLRV